MGDTGSYTDIVQLRPLKEIGAKFNATFKIHGGVAFRYALRAETSGHSRPNDDLFELAPFTADVDVLHSGKSKDNERILWAILHSVPNADCFRWEVRSEESEKVFERAAEEGNSVPARRIRLTASGYQDPADGLSDIRKTRYRYIRKPSFRDTSLARQGSDLEVFSALLYLQTLFEAGLNATQIQQSDLVSVSILFNETMNEGQIVESVARNTYLQRRLIYLLINCLAAATAEQRAAVDAFCRLETFLRWVADRLPIPDALQVYIRSGPEAGLVLCSSAWIESDQTRLPLATGPWIRDSAQETFETCAKNQGTLAADQLVLLASPDMAVSQGGSISSRSPGGPSEFIHFVIPSDAFLAPYSDVDLSILAAIQASPPAPEVAAQAFIEAAQLPLARAGQRFRHVLASVAASGALTRTSPGWIIFSVPAVVQRTRLLDTGSSPLFVRANMMGLLGSIASWSAADAKLFLIARKAQ
jgi:hypothetical protein